MSDHYWELQYSVRGMKPRDAFRISYNFKTKRAAERMQKFLRKEAGALLADDAGFDVNLEVISPNKHFKDQMGVEALFWKMIDDVKGLSKDEYLDEFKGLSYADDYIPSFEGWDSEEEEEKEKEEKKDDKKEEEKSK